MVADATWPLRGYSSTDTPEKMYDYERGNLKVTDNPDEIKSYIGLMYPSDYGYSVLASNCSRSTNIGNYHSASCGGKSWLYGQGLEWTMTPYSSSTSSNYYINYDGRVNAANPNIGYAVRPVVYLNSSVYVIEGDGSINNPFIIRMPK